MNKAKREYRKVTKKDVFQAITVVAYGIISVYAYQTSHKLIAYLMLIGAIVFVFIHIFRLPKETLDRISKEMMDRESTPTGKAMKYVSIGMKAVLFGYLIYWIVVKYLVSR